MFGLAGMFGAGGGGLSSGQSDQSMTRTSSELSQSFGGLNKSVNGIDNTTLIVMAAIAGLVLMVKFK